MVNYTVSNTRKMEIIEEVEKVEIIDEVKKKNR